MKYTIALLLASLTATSALAADYSFQSVVYPNASLTALEGINNRGEIVGMFEMGPWEAGSFKLINNSFQIVAVPGAIKTHVSNINNTTIVGDYFDPTCNCSKGFTKTKNRKQLYTTVIMPVAGVTGTIPRAINNYNWIVGEYFDNSDLANGPVQQHGFVLENGTYRTIDIPGSIATAVTGINDSGHIVGYWNSPIDGSSQGFVGHFNGILNALMVPGMTDTYPVAINNAGHIVGIAIDATERVSGWLYDGYSFTTIAVPNTILTIPLAISNDGKIVGYYNDGVYLIKGFVATPLVMVW